MTSEQADAVLQGLTMPTCLLLASDSDEGGQRWMADRASAHIPDVQIHTVSGGHHFHLEAGAIEAADRINKFMNER